MKVIPHVSEIRKQGIKVKVNHLRDFYKFDSKTGKKSVIRTSFELAEELHPDYYLDARGGATVVLVDHPQFGKLNGMSECSTKDIFNKKVGTMKALAQALAPTFSKD
jgi:hypothetical protein